jgi:prepilin-type N-terminal cleavage/methylation domain-containing protein
MKLPKQKKNAGFSLIELMAAMVVTLILLSLISMILMSTFGTRRRESQRTDAMTSAKAALNLMSREISNAGYGLTTNGIVVADSDFHKLRFRTNIENDNSSTNSPNEDVMYYHDAVNETVMRYDRNGTPQVSVLINGVSEASFEYFDYSGSSSTSTQKLVPSNNTGRIRINVTVRLDDVEGQVEEQAVSFTSEVTLRNSKYMLKLY